MKISETSIRRPVLAAVMSLLLVLVGLVSYSLLEVREYPRIDEPVVNVNTRLTGASSEVIESTVTKPLEDSIAGIEGIEIISSVSRAEESQITARFTLSRSPDDAAADVRDRVSRVRARLPDAVDEPVISKVEADASPTIWLAFTSDTMSPLEVTDIVSRIVRPRLQTVPGVADVTLRGDRTLAMRVWVDPDQLAAYQLTVQDVEDAIRRQNLEVPAGRIESQQREFSVTAQTNLTTPAQFGEITLRTAGGYSVRLRDVARIEQAAASERSSVRLNGQPAVSTGVIRQATANPLEVAAGVRAVLPRLQQELPPGLQVQAANDNSIFIDRSIKSVYTTIAEAVVLVALVVFVFLRTLRASIIPLVTIPVSLIGAFALMAAVGFTVNTLTLLALVLAIGLVVDDAIVMLENVYRHVEEGLSPFKAALEVGTREIELCAIIAMTLTLAAVYAPVAFAPGRTGRLFLEFALTLASAVLVSGFVRADADADDVQQAAAPQPAAGPLRPLHGGHAGRSFRRLPGRAALRARPALDRAARDGGFRGRQLVVVPHHQERARAAGGSRRGAGHRQCAGRRDARVHPALHAGGRAPGPGVPGVRPGLRRHRQPDGLAGHRLHAHGRLE